MPSTGSWRPSTRPDRRARHLRQGRAGAAARMCASQAAADGEQPLDRAYWAEQIALAASARRARAGLCREAPPTGQAGSRSPISMTVCSSSACVGFIDPPRDDAIAAIAECRSAGIAVKMITGDHAATAAAIARQLGMADAPERGHRRRARAPTDDALADLVARADVFARTSPEHKLRIVRALQARGAVVAMTGDGVNDAPALKQADVGIAMGRKGTEAAKEAAEMVLLDDHFASIVAAVHEGRTVYDNIRKVIAWTLPTNGGEVLTRASSRSCSASHADDRRADPVDQPDHRGDARPGPGVRTAGAGRHAAAAAAGRRAAALPLPDLAGVPGLGAVRRRRARHVLLCAGARPRASTWRGPWSSTSSWCSRSSICSTSATCT